MHAMMQLRRTAGKRQAFVKDETESDVVGCGARHWYMNGYGMYYLTFRVLFPAQIESEKMENSTYLRAMGV